MDGLANLLSKNKSDLLDPLSVIIKLFIMSFKQNGTKISVCNYRINIQDQNIIQGLFRKLNGDNKNDIAILTVPITYACKYYLDTPDLYKKYGKLFETASKGLIKIRDTYDQIAASTSTTTSIVYLINNMNDIIMKHLGIFKLPADADQTSSMDEIPLSVEHDRDKNGLLKTTYIIYGELTNIWTERRLSILFNFIDEILDETKEKTQVIIVHALEKFMELIDSYIYAKMCGVTDT